VLNARTLLRVAASSLSRQQCVSVASAFAEKWMYTVVCVSLAGIQLQQPYKGIKNPKYHTLFGKLSGELSW
jgi:hypothetical protein